MEKSIKLAKNLAQYQSKWVALDKEKTKVVASANTLADLAKETKKIGHTIIVQYVLPADRALAPLCLSIA